MKIFILHTPKDLQPGKQPFKYPLHNADYGIEQDFLEFLERNHIYTTPDPKDADFHYLPVFWTRWILNHDFGKHGLPELAEAVKKIIIDDSKTFTVCQNDDGPMIDLGKTIVYLGSRKTNEGKDAPLLCSHHKLPFFKQKKKFLSTFIGRISTHPIRTEMAAEISSRKDSAVYDGDKGTAFFVKTMLRSHVALCPRGYGGSSFRFYEAMQLGTVPFLIGDIDTRPFKKQINWDDFTFFTNDAKQINSILDKNSKEQLLEKGARCKKFYEEHLVYQKWCNYLLEELKTK
ncbi:MAG: exostosin domain-containing protein [Bacteroidia bacterium]